MAYRASQAVGSFALINCIFFYNISKRTLERIKETWPEPKKPSHEAFSDFLNSRPASQAYTLADLLTEPQLTSNGWARYSWKAFDEASLEQKTKEGEWKGYDADWKDAWHGTKFECVYKTMIEG